MTLLMIIRPSFFVLRKSNEYEFNVTRRKKPVAITAK